MTIEEQRNAISKVYPSERWKNTVEKMDDNQVIAIYLGFEKRGILGKVISKPYQRKEEANSKKIKYEPKQLSFDDIMKTSNQTGSGNDD